MRTGSERREAIFWMLFVPMDVSLPPPRRSRINRRHLDAGGKLAPLRGSHGLHICIMLHATGRIFSLSFSTPEQSIAVYLSQLQQQTAVNDNGMTPKPRAFVNRVNWTGIFSHVASPRAYPLLLRASLSSPASIQLHPVTEDHELWRLPLFREIAQSPSRQFQKHCRRSPGVCVCLSLFVHGLVVQQAT